MTHVEIIRIYSLQVIRISVKVKAVSEQIEFHLSNNITEGPYYMCVLCNRCLHRRLVINFENNNAENNCTKLNSIR